MRLAASLTDVIEGAHALLGCRLVRTGRRGRRVVRIVETEAYPHDDPACHAYGGPTARNRSMFGPAGRAYVYRIHRSFCLNVVTGPAKRGEAVLIRAVEPLEGLDLMRRARERATVGANRPDGFQLTNGPGKLCQALDVDLALDGEDLLAVGDSRPLRLLPRTNTPRVVCSRRIGISVSVEAPLRFSIEGNPWVSRQVRVTNSSALEGWIPTVASN